MNMGKQLRTENHEFRKNTIVTLVWANLMVDTAIRGLLQFLEG
jgi:hypothetical protein